MPAQSIRNLRTVLAVPMLREGIPIGAVAIWRSEARPFSEAQIKLVTTFAAQAVIAIENVRLFQELEARTAQLTRSVDGAAGARRGRTGGQLHPRPGDGAEHDRVAGRPARGRRRRLDLRVRRGHPGVPAPARLTTTTRSWSRASGPRRSGWARGSSGRAAERREPMQVPDIVQEGAYQSHLRDILLRMGYRALLAVPLVREDQVIGALVDEPASARGVPARGRRAPEDVRHPVGAGHPERAALPRDRGEGPPARGRQPAQVPVPGQHEPRAQDAR